MTEPQLLSQKVHVKIMPDIGNGRQASSLMTTVVGECTDQRGVMSRSLRNKGICVVSRYVPQDLCWLQGEIK